MSLMLEMNQKALDLGIPLSVHLDVTYRCNERCVHCYLDHEDLGEMTTAEIKDVLDQLAEAGVSSSRSVAAKSLCAAIFSALLSMHGTAFSTSK